MLKNKTSFVPSSGIIFPPTKVVFYEGESVFNVLLRELKKDAMIHGGMFLGEGTGAIALFPLLDLAHAVYSEMSTFDDIAVEQYEDYK